jgi:hypothetical protein
MSEPSPSEMLEHAWRYFDLHAGQRISLFNFSLVVEGTMGAGLAACLLGSALLNASGVALGALMGFVSFIFWKLDQRTSFLIKHAEDAMGQIEETLPIAAARIVSREASLSAQRTGSGSMWTYSEVLRLGFLVMGAVGGSGALVCLWLLRAH